MNVPAYAKVVKCIRCCGKGRAPASGTVGEWCTACDGVGYRLKLREGEIPPGDKQPKERSA